MSGVRTAPIEAALEALAGGRPVLVADDVDRENEADAVISAASAQAVDVAWIIRHSSGYLCAPMTQARADALALPLMVPHSQDPRRTAYTVTVDAAVGISTGISAADRARTLRVLADPASGPDSLIRPGHVLPLRAVPGGVLHRAGHTEAAVDLCRLAGLAPIAALAELVNDDGTMMRLPDASRTARRAGLVLVTIADLIAWRRAHGDEAQPVAQSVQPRVVRTGVATLPTRHGRFRMVGYRDTRTGAEHVALVAGDDTDSEPGHLAGLADAGAGPDQPGEPLPAPNAARAAPHIEAEPDPALGRGRAPSSRLVRVHSECLTGDAFASARCDCGAQLDAALARVAQAGGAVVYLRGQEGRGIGLLAKIDAYALQDRGWDTVEANRRLGWPVDRREYGAAAAILRDLGLSEVTLMTNNPAKVTGLAAHGITVAQVERLEVGRNRHNEAYLATKAQRMGHTLGSPASAPDAGPATEGER